MKREVKILMLILFSVLLIVPLTSAGFIEDIWGKITGKAVGNFGLNITVGITRIVFVDNNSTSTRSIGSSLNSGPNPTSIIINFSVYQGAGSQYLNDSTARLNVSFSGGTTLEYRENTSCARYETGANYKNYTCNLSLWWFDSAGTWSIAAYITDNFSNMVINKSTNFSVSSLNGFEVGPGNLTWSSIGAGSYNSTALNDPLTLNNTGNQYVNISINATDLKGETTPSLALWSGNFSVSTFTGGGACVGAACLECVGNNMSRNAGNYANITEGNLTRGNYTINNDITGQEELYFCLRYAGSELTSQAYSTQSQGAWTIRI